jgi:hypothetical protein
MSGQELSYNLVHAEGLKVVHNIEDPQASESQARPRPTRPDVQKQPPQVACILNVENEKVLKPECFGRPPR